MIITDLTNTQWTFQYGLDDGTGSGQSSFGIDVLFVCGGVEYDRLEISGTRTPYYEWYEIKRIRYHKVGDNVMTYQTAYENGVWYLPSSITITGATSAGTEWQLTDDGNITKLIRYCTTWKKVSFVVRNGTWADGTSRNKHIWTDVNSFNAHNEIPSGMIPSPGYSSVGAWTEDPYSTKIEDDASFVYTFREPLPEYYDVFYDIRGGTWGDGTTARLTEAVEEGSYPQEYPIEMIPSSGYLNEGAWTPQDPWTKQITRNTYFLWEFTPEQPPIPPTVWTVVLRIVNGMWEDGSITAKTYYVVDGETIPEVPTGMFPFDGFGNGRWDRDPSVPIYDSGTYVYTFQRVEPSRDVHYFILDDVRSIDMGVYIGGQNTYNAPKRDVTKISVPGRNGDLIQDNGRFLNVSVPYNVVVMEEFRERTDELKAWLLHTSKYRKLADTYHPGTYRLARVGADITFNTSAFNLTGKSKIIFDCKPQRFLDEGDDPILITETGTVIYNPTLFDAEPIITIFVSDSGTHTLQINDYEITVSEIEEFVVVDSSVKECYKEGLGMNSHVVMANYRFPVLVPGDNEFIFSSGIERVEVVPKWWTI